MTAQLYIPIWTIIDANDLADKIADKLLYIPIWTIIDMAKWNCTTATRKPLHSNMDDYRHVGNLKKVVFVPALHSNMDDYRLKFSDLT